MVSKSVDKSQAGIVSALRAAGCSVQNLSDVGGGTPDILVGFRGQNYLLECKSPEVKGRKREFTPAQDEWQFAWRGSYSVVYTPDDALRAIGAIE